MTTPSASIREAAMPRSTPGDVYDACLLAREIGRPCSYVVDAYEREVRGAWQGPGKGKGKGRD